MMMIIIIITWYNKNLISIRMCTSLVTTRITYSLSFLNTLHAMCQDTINSYAYTTRYFSFFSLRSFFFFFSPTCLISSDFNGMLTSLTRENNHICNNILDSVSCKKIIYLEGSFLSSSRTVFHHSHISIYTTSIQIYIYSRIESRRVRTVNNFNYEKNIVKS